MARLSDILTVYRCVGPFGFFKRVWGQVAEDNLLAWAAALAYSWLFAIFPFLIALLSLLPYLPERAKESAGREVRNYLYQIMSEQAAETVWDNVKFVLEKPKRGVLSMGLLISLWAASGGMNMTINALDRCYEIPRGRPFYLQRPLSIVLTLVVVSIMLLVLVLLPVTSLALAWLQRHSFEFVSTPVVWVARIARFPIAVLLMFLVLSVVYHFGPKIKQKYRFITPGSVFCVVVWMGLAMVFRLYLDGMGKAANYKETYGTVGGVAILLLFFYLDALVLLIGAEINSEIDFEVLGVERGATDFTIAKGAAAAPAPESSQRIETVVSETKPDVIEFKSEI